MLMKPPAVPANHANAPSYEDLVNTLEQIRHATAPTPDDGGHHEAAHDLADAMLKRVQARHAYEASRDQRQVCTCDGAGRGAGRACVVQGGGRLGDGWRCAAGHKPRRSWDTPTWRDGVR